MNRGSLVLEATTLPTAPQPQPNFKRFYPPGPKKSITFLPVFWLVLSSFLSFFSKKKRFRIGKYFDTEKSSKLITKGYL